MRFTLPKESKYEIVIDNPKLMRYVEIDDEEAIIEILREDCKQIRYVKNQTERICKYAIKCDFWSVEHIHILYFSKKCTNRRECVKTVLE